MWRVYRLIFRLRSPVHIGWKTVSNLKYTRPYVTGRALWGALTMRLTRYGVGNGPAIDSRVYRLVGKQVNQFLSFTYFFPATRGKNDYEVSWFWQDTADFRRRFFSSYVATSIQPFQQSAEAGMLREVEFISPHTLDSAEQVFFVGYFFEREDNELNWQKACQHLQLGGERGYGWGSVELVEINKMSDNILFGGAMEIKSLDNGPLLHLAPSKNSPKRVLAHTVASNIPVTGEIEPLVGREWRSYHSNFHGPGEYVDFCGICFAPGSIVERELDLVVGEFGIWKVA